MTPQAPFHNQVGSAFLAHEPLRTQGHSQAIGCRSGYPKHTHPKVTRHQISLRFVTSHLSVGRDWEVLSRMRDRPTKVRAKRKYVLMIIQEACDSLFTSIQVRR
jgi:hypothetical protein